MFCKAHLAEVLRNTAPFKKLGAGSREKSDNAEATTVNTEMLGQALQRCFFELDVALSDKKGVKEMRRYARAEDRKRQLSLGNVDLEEMAEAAEACGLTTAQLRAVIATQVSERIKNKRRRAGDDGEDSEEEGCNSDCEDCHGGGCGRDDEAEEGVTVTREDSRSEESLEGGSSAEPSAASSLRSSAGNTGGGGNVDEEAGVTTEEALSDDSLSCGESRQSAEAAASAGPFSDLRPHPRKGGVGVESGATAVVAVLGVDSEGSFLTVANAGDSRCVLCRADGSAENMSEDHKPEDALELARVEAAGGSVVEGRIEGNLNLSRAIGDLLYKRNMAVSVEAQMISALPDIKTVRLNTPPFTAGVEALCPVETSSSSSSSSSADPSGGAVAAGSGGDRFVVLACDGIWNSMESQEVVDFVAERLDRGVALGTVCEDLLDHCLAPDTDGDGTGCDNMTMMVVLLPGFTPAVPRKRPTTTQGSSSSVASAGPSSSTAVKGALVDSTGTLKRPAEGEEADERETPGEAGNKQLRQS